MTLLLIIIGVNLAAWCWIVGKAVTQRDPVETPDQAISSHQI